MSFDTDYGQGLREMPSMSRPSNKDIETFVIAYEVKWRSRVNTENPYDADPYARVGRNEMADWCKASQVAIDPLLDALYIQPALNRMFKRLRREFPQEFARWPE